MFCYRVFIYFDNMEKNMLTRDGGIYKTLVSAFHSVRRGYKSWKNYIYILFRIVNCPCVIGKVVNKIAIRRFLFKWVVLMILLISGRNKKC